MFAWVLVAMGGCWFTDEELCRAGEGRSSLNDDAGSDYATDVGIEMVGIPSGSFCMGSHALDADQDEQPPRTVTLTRPFWIGKSEVTQAHYEAVAGETPSGFAECADCPVEQVTWFKAVTFANAVSDAEALDRCYTTSAEPEPVGNPYDCEGYRLPTEAEWEYAARGGESYTYAGSDDLDEVGWYEDNSEVTTQAAGAKEANGFGAFDMSGNVGEWVGDWYDSRHYRTGMEVDPTGAAGGSYRTFRGGAWSLQTKSARVADRDWRTPSARANFLGFRLARTTP